MPFDEDDRIARPIGVGRPSGRLLGMRQILTILLILALGSVLGTGAYFLSTLDLDQIIGLMDVSDHGPRLVLRLPPPSQQGATGPAGAEVRHAPAPPPPKLVAIPAMPQADLGEKAPSYTALPAVPSAAPLVAAPIKAVSETTPAGVLPQIGPNGQIPWRVYARPFAIKPNRKLVAIVVTGLGLDRTATEAAIYRLPADVTLAFDPYSRDLVHWAAKARKAGHEILVDLPMSGGGVRDPGALGLRTDLPEGVDNRRLRAVLARVPGAIGVLAPESAFTGSAQGAMVQKVLAKRGLIYVGNGALVQGAAPVVPVAEIVGHDLWKGAIAARLANTAALAKSYGGATVVVQPSPIALDQLAAWLRELSSQGITPAPVSALVASGSKKEKP